MITKKPSMNSGVFKQKSTLEAVCLAKRCA